MATKHTHFDSTEFNTLRNSAIPAAIMASPNTRFDSAEEASVFFAQDLRCGIPRADCPEQFPDQF